ncbi:MAG: heme exporter protein CcmD [Rhizobiales bacterium]|jgi:heme exporter protein D|nr:heme exporter protein CcmD [Hyphomicrobiales bacterium]
MTPDLGFGLNLGPHADFIIAAYAIAALVVIVLIGWVALDHRAQKRRLASLEARGVTRRSDRAVERTA